MKRISTFIQNMSLTQQLVSLVLISIFLFGFFLLSYIFANIDHIAQDQMFESIHRSQDAVIENYYNFVSEENVFNNSDPTVIHYIIFTDDSRETLTNAATHISPDLLAEFTQKIKMQTTMHRKERNNMTTPLASENRFKRILRAANIPPVYYFLIFVFLFSGILDHYLADGR